MILQNEPDLTPLEVKKRIVETAVILPNGCSLADADAAINARLSGRKWWRSRLLLTSRGK